MKHFLVPTIGSLMILGAIYAFLGPVAFIAAILLTILEVTLSFDNAVVNARVLADMTPKWQKRFLTWGMLIAVFGTRLVLPILIVSVSVWLSPLEVASLAAFAQWDPDMFVDLHTTDGSYHGYALTYSPSLHPGAPLAAFNQDTLLPELQRRVQAKWKVATVGA